MEELQSCFNMTHSFSFTSSSTDFRKLRTKHLDSSKTWKETHTCGVSQLGAEFCLCSLAVPMAAKEEVYLESGSLGLFISIVLNDFQVVKVLSPLLMG